MIEMVEWIENVVVRPMSGLNKSPQSTQPDTKTVCGHRPNSRAHLKLMVKAESKLNSPSNQSRRFSLLRRSIQF
jgi:hypothetical protein